MSTQGEGLVVSHNGQQYNVRRSYLVKFVQPQKLYPVEYAIRQDGTRNYGLTEILGADLTEPQIVDLFIKELL
jgi:hypothetical protein